MKRPEDRISIRVLYGINRLFTRVYHSLTIVNGPKLPESGPAIVVCNHISGLDPLLVQSAVDRRLITWMMAREYLDLPGLGKVFRTVEVIPVERGSRETTPLRTAVRQLMAGRVVGIFPEGMIGKRGLLEFQTGAALMAIRTKTPVFPVYIEGTQRGREMLQAFATPCRAWISFGPPLDLSRFGTDRKDLQEATDLMRAAIENEKKYIVDFRNVR
jgi:1-acyl-sn-glycerol-3-phosphate acyltransferase